MRKISALIIVLLLFAACEQPQHQRDDVVDESGAKQEGFPEQQEAAEVNFTKAVAVLQPAGGSNVKGIVTFTREEDGIKVTAELSGLKQGRHGFHIHEFGDCSAPDASSAGGHFNPLGNQHAGPASQNRHAGDLGNIEADANGNARLELIDSGISFSGANSIIGHAVVVHEKEDDFTSQPTGDAGGRLACGVIGISGDSDN